MRAGPDPLTRSTLPPSELRFCGFVPVAASPVVTHRNPSGPNRGRQPECRPDGLAGMPVTMSRRRISRSGMAGEPEADDPDVVGGVEADEDPAVVPEPRADGDAEHPALAVGDQAGGAVDPAVVTVAPQSDPALALGDEHRPVGSEGDVPRVIQAVDERPHAIARRHRGGACGAGWASAGSSAPGSTIASAAADRAILRILRISEPPRFPNHPPRGKLSQGTAGLLSASHDEHVGWTGGGRDRRQQGPGAGDGDRVRASRRRRRRRQPQARRL